MGEALGMGPMLPACPGPGGGGLGLLCVAVWLPAPRCPDPRGASVLPSAAAGGREGGWSLLEKVTLCACSSLGCGCWSQGRLRAACVLLLMKECGGGRQQPQLWGLLCWGSQGVRGRDGAHAWCGARGAVALVAQGSPVAPLAGHISGSFLYPGVVVRAQEDPGPPLRPPAPSPVSAARSLLAGHSGGHAHPGLAACSQCAYAAVAPSLDKP